MFGPPRCPIDPYRKAWIDSRFAWLIDRLGFDALRTPQVLMPTRAFFPEVFDGEWEVEALAKRVAEHMGVVPGEVEVQVHEEMPEPLADGYPEYQAGVLYSIADGQASIHVHESIAEHAERLVAVLGLEFSRHALLRDGLLSEDSQVAALTAELHTVFRGLGIFSANAQLRAAYRLFSGDEWWQSSRLGGLDPVDYGYALALFAWLRGESRPAWLSALRQDVLHACKACLKYLSKTGDALVQPTGDHRDPTALADGKLEERLQQGSAADRIAALWHVRERCDVPAGVGAAVLECVEHEHRAVRGAALWTIRSCELDREQALAAVLDAMVDTSDEVCVAAVSTLTSVCEDPAILRRELLPLLERKDLPVVQSAALTIGSLGAEGSEFTPELDDALGRALLRMDGPTVAVVLSALHMLKGDAEAHLIGSALWDDPIQTELLREGLESIRAHGVARVQGFQEPAGT